VKAVVAVQVGASPFGTYSVISLNDLQMTNSSQIVGDTASNGNISLSNSAQICGDLAFGVGKLFTTANSSGQCSGHERGPLSEPMVLNPVVAPTTDDDARIGTLDLFSGGVPSGTWNSSTRVLRLRNSTVLTLTGDVYTFCNLELSNSAQLVIAGRESFRPPVKIYIDDPANCPGVTNAGSVSVRNSSSIQNLNATHLQILSVGSAGIATTIEFSNSFSSPVPIVIYAPRSTVLLRNSQNFSGAIAAKQVTLQNSSSITAQPVSFTIGEHLQVHQRQSWTECAVRQSGSEPDAGC
jgi:hypothetical protein